MQLSRLIPVLSMLPLLGAMLSCSETPDQALSPEPQGSGQALLKITAAADSPFSRIADHATVTVSAPDMLTMSSALTVTDSSVEGSITGIPAGKDRLFEVEVFDSVDTVQYRGSGVADVVADSSVKVAINVVRVSGAVVIDGSIVEGDSLPVEGLVAWYPFDGNADDESGGGNNGVVSGASLAADRFDNADRAYAFDGTAEITIPYSSTFAFDTLDFSISIWIKIAPFSDAFKCFLAYACPNLGGSGGFQLAVAENASHPLWLEMGTTVDHAIDAGAHLADYQWHHLVLIADRETDIVTVYGDGDSLGQVVVPSSYTYTPSCQPSVRIGGERNGWQRHYFVGFIDDVRFYERHLTAGEIGILFHEGGWNGYPVIDSQPQPTTLQVGQTARFSVHATGISLTYQWYKNGAPISGANLASYTTPTLAIGDNNTWFKCAVSNGSAVTWSDSAKLTVTAGPVGEFSADANTLALWHLNQDSGTTLADASGNGRNATIVGATWTAGMAGSALQFDGVSNYVTADFTVPIRNVSFEMWVKSDTADNKTGGVVLCAYGMNTWAATVNGSDPFQTRAVWPEVANKLRSGDWNYLACTIDNGDTGRFYANGRLLKTSLITETARSWSRIYLGAIYFTSMGGFLKGSIDEVRISNTVRSATEIEQAWTSTGRTLP